MRIGFIYETFEKIVNKSAFPEVYNVELERKKVGLIRIFIGFIALVRTVQIIYYYNVFYSNHQYFSFALFSLILVSLVFFIFGFFTPIFTLIVFLLIVTLNFLLVLLH